MKYGYCRVSTKIQLKGNSLEEQRNKLLSEGCDVIYEEQFTGTTTDRPVFNELLSKLVEGDTLMITKLDRFARTTVQGITLANELMNKGVKVHILNMGLLEDTPTGRLIFSILSSFAEYERDLIYERCQTGRMVARTKAGYKEGRPRKFTDEQIEHALSLLETNSYSKVAKMTQISKSTLVRANRLRSTT